MRLTAVARMFDRPGPFLTVYRDVSRDTEDAAHIRDTRWRAAGERLMELGAPEAVVRAAGERLAEPTGMPGRVARMLVADDSGVLLDDVVPRPGQGEVLSWEPLPDLAAWLADRAASLPVLLVVADREGADLSFHPSWPGPAADRAEVHGETLHMTKVAVGDWAHKQFQRRSEEVWRRNGEDVAAEIEDMVGRGVSIVALTGDVRAVGAVEDALGAATRDLVVELEHGSRAPGSSTESLDHDLAEAVRDRAVRDHLSVVRDLEERTGRDEGAAHGLTAVLGALVQGQVETLVLAARVLGEHLVHPGEYPGLDLPGGALGYDAVRADLVVIAAAARTDADIVVAGGTAVLPDDGVAALLRWSVPSDR